ncbi:MAG: NfeD family protein, partial [Victivallaceae bacterium]
AAEEQNCRALIFEVDTPGGAVDTALKYVAQLNNSTIQTIALVNDKAISAGMIAVLGANRIYMAPNGLIGAAMPLEQNLESGVRPLVINEKDPKSSELVDNKFLSVLFKELEVMAQKNNRPVRVIRAMADPKLSLTAEADGIDHAGNMPLTLGTAEAVRLKVADGAASSVKQAAELAGYQNPQIIRYEFSAWDKIMLFLANPVVCGILITLAIVCFVVELHSPGMGIPGGLGTLAIVLFFVGQAWVGNSEWEPAVVFFVGLILVAVEIFIIPGFGIVGILGFAGIIISLFYALGVDNLAMATNIIVYSFLAAAAICSWLIFYVLPKSTVGRFNLKSIMSRDSGVKSYEPDCALIGREGITGTVLRPSGMIVIDGQRYDGRSNGDMIERGRRIVVIGSSSYQLVVEELDGDHNVSIKNKKD